MAGIDIGQITYAATVINGKGTKFILDSVLLALSWEEQDGQLAQKVSMRIAADTKVGKKWLRSVLSLNSIVRIYSSFGKGRKKIFDGYIWEWQFDRSGSGKELIITAYDPMIRLMQSKDYKYFCAGLTTPDLLGGICSDWGIKLSYNWDQKITHKKKVFNGDAVSDMILGSLEEVRRQTGKRYTARYGDGALQILGYGTNKDVYIFTKDNTISSSDKLSMSNLVTKIKVIGKADDDGRSSVEAVIKGNTEYGVLQEVVQRESDKDLAAAKAEAQVILDERGKPEESITVTSSDLPFLRKGYRVRLDQVANLSGTFYVLGVSHNASLRQMTMTLLRAKDV